MAENVMREIKLEKVILNIGGVGEKLDKGEILLKTVSGKKPIKVKAVKRIPTWNVRPGLEVGVKVTLRGKDALAMVKKLLPAIDNTLKEKQIQTNCFSFGIAEYIEIPGLEYIREVGIMGFEVTVVFSRAGKSVETKKVKRGKSRRLSVSREEIENYLVSNFKTEIIRKKKRIMEETE
ncbi:MAG: 50S ribosomal protein L5 [Candidatus Omnitrophica bacterium]|nr:50S ribosomal protein L5 [Candidatus Omnitrophota bacterium]